MNKYLLLVLLLFMVVEVVLELKIAQEYCLELAVLVVAVMELGLV